MGKWIHRISNVDEVAKMADCSNCGRVRVRMKRHWACTEGIKQRRTKEESANSETRKRRARVQLGELHANPGTCEICGRLPERGLVIDHDHTNGHLRGWLCGQCNTGIGMLQDNPEILAKAIKYIKKDRNAT